MQRCDDVRHFSMRRDPVTQLRHRLKAHGRTLNKLFWSEYLFSGQQQQQQQQQQQGRGRERRKPKGENNNSFARTFYTGA